MYAVSRSVATIEMTEFQLSDTDMKSEEQMYHWMHNITDVIQLT